MTTPRPIKLTSDTARAAALMAVTRAPDGFVCKIEAPKRTLDANAKFHAMLADIVKAGFKHDDHAYDIDDLKTLFVSSWMIQTGRRSQIVKGFEGEAVQLRRSTTTFSKQEMGELIELVEAFCAQHGIKLRAVEYDHGR